MEPITADLNTKLQQSEVFQSYKRSKYLSLKHSSYFHVYEGILAKYRGRSIIFIEIGVLNGGSLFMWRDYLGPAARIIGIDANPDARKWEKDNFEILIGDQSDSTFWDRVFAHTGPVDVVLDDGGHANEQQIITTEKCIPNIKDDGVLIVEDTHASYLTRFGNPSKYSFIAYCKTIIDSINSRFPSITASRNNLNKIVSSIEFYESIVCYRIDRQKCFTSSLLSNEGASSAAEDFRDHGSLLHDSVDLIVKHLPVLERSAFINRVGTRMARRIFSIRAKFKSRKVAKYFR